jgi:hypothetical protein
MLCTGASPHRYKIIQPGIEGTTALRRFHLVVKTTFLVKEVKELRVRFATPEVKVSYLKVTPN